LKEFIFLNDLFILHLILKLITGRSKKTASDILAIADMS